MNMNEVDRVEIITLQDNYIDITDMSTNPVVSRANPLDGLEIKRSVLSEHGFSAVVRTTTGDTTKTMVFDFGFSEQGAAYNARILGLDMSVVEAMALSHGHIDHTGGLDAIVEMIGRKGLPFVVHPAAFASPRYLKYSEELKIYFPKFTRDMVTKNNLHLIESEEPYTVLDGDVLFLGEIPRITDFEKGFPIAHTIVGGIEQWDPIRDDTALVMNLRGKGLIVLSGCAHSGIINTLGHARSITGVDRVHAVMGGFHLSGPLFEPIIDRTAQELKEIGPDYVIPTHCTGRKAIMHIEEEMPAQFILNMSGTRLTFSA